MEEGKAFCPTAEQLASVDLNISNSEVEYAIKQLKVGKSPCADGFSGEFYICDQITPTLTSYFTDILKTGYIGPESTNAYIKVLSKKAKIPSARAHTG